MLAMDLRDSQKKDQKLAINWFVGIENISRVRTFDRIYGRTLTENPHVELDRMLKIGEFDQSSTPITYVNFDRIYLNNIRSKFNI